MKRLAYITAILLVLSSCTKEEPARRSGTDTIDNTRYMSSTYYVYGFTFSTGKKVSTEANPGPDISVDVTGVPDRLILQANSFRPSFWLAGTYADDAAAKSAFDNLKNFSATNWVDIADPVLPHQVWVFRSGADNYTKFRIVSTINEQRTGMTINYGEVTFEWVHQPDGTTTFP